jgi:hypothetical protein
MTDMPDRLPDVAHQLELAFEVEQSKSGRFLRWIGLMIGVGLLYMSASIAVMYHLVAENNEDCASRQAARGAYRSILIASPDWTSYQQSLLDKYLPVEIGCD